MYVKVYSREYTNALDAMLLDQFKDLANLYVAGRPASTHGPIADLVRTIDAIWDRGLVR